MPVENRCSALIVFRAVSETGGLGSLKSPSTAPVFFRLWVLGNIPLSVNSPTQLHFGGFDPLTAGKRPFNSELHVADERQLFLKEVRVTLQYPFHGGFLITFPIHIQGRVF